MDFLFRTLFIGATLGLVYWLMHRKASKPALLLPTGQASLRMSRLWSVLGYAGIFLGSIFLILQLADRDVSGGLTTLIIVLGLLFLLSGLYLIIWQINSRVMVDEEKMQITNWLAQTKTVYWKNIKRVRFRSLAGRLVFTDQGGKRYVVHQNMNGLSTLLYQLEKHTDFRASELKISVKPEPGVRHDQH